MKSRHLFLVLALAATGLAIYAALSNISTTVDLGGFGAPLHAPEGSLVLAGYLCGLISTAAVWATKKQRSIAGEQKKVEWAKQDEKLAVEVASDQVKLLEAKIATLEVALQAALERNKKKS